MLPGIMSLALGMAPVSRAEPRFTARPPLLRELGARVCALPEMTPKARELKGPAGQNTQTNPQKQLTYLTLRACQLHDV